HDDPHQCVAARPQHGRKSRGALRSCLDQGDSAVAYAYSMDRSGMNESNARLWHPWLRINRVPRVMLQTRWSAGAWSGGHSRVQEGARAEKRDPACGGQCEFLADFSIRRLPESD